jgi:hypothetical protein
MTTTRDETLIPRDRLTPILDRHNDVWNGTHDPEAWTVRGAAQLLRQSPEPDYRAEADELDALVDEVEAAAWPTTAPTTKEQP